MDKHYTQQLNFKGIKSLEICGQIEHTVWSTAYWWDKAFLIPEIKIVSSFHTRNNDPIWYQNNNSPNHVLDALKWFRNCGVDPTLLIVKTQTSPNPVRQTTTIFKYLLFLYNVKWQQKCYRTFEKDGKTTQNCGLMRWCKSSGLWVIHLKWKFWNFWNYFKRSCNIYSGLQITIKKFF